MKKLRGTAFVAATAMAVSWSALPCRAQDADLQGGPPAPKASDSRPGVDIPRGDGRRTLGAFPKKPIDR